MTKPIIEELTVVCYDIADDKRRRAVVRVLEGYGIRVQESVFECWLEPDERRSLAGDLNRCIDSECDRVGLYILSRRETDDVRLLGISAQLVENPSNFLV